MKEIANIIKQLETRKAVIDRALEAVRDFAQTGSITPEKSTRRASRARKGALTAEGRRRLALAMKRRWAAKRAGAQAKKATAKKKGVAVEGRRKRADTMKRRRAAKPPAAQVSKEAA